MDTKTSTNSIKILPRYRVLEANKKVDIKKINKRKTTEQYKDELEIKNPTIMVLEEYKGANVNIEHMCLICKYIWKPRPSNVLFGTKCPLCAGNIKLTTEQFKEKISENIILRSEYLGANKPIKCECRTCKCVWEVKLAGSLQYQKYGCPNCSNKNDTLRMTQEEFLYKISITNPNIIIDSEYISVSSDIKCICKKCGHHWRTQAGHLIYGKVTGCPKCANNINLSHEQFMCKLPKFLFDRIEIIDSFKNYSTKIKCRCKVCNNIYMADPNHLICGNGCNICSKKRNGITLRKSNKDFVNEIREIFGEDIVVIGQYITSKDRIDVKCLKCNFEWSPVASSLVSGFGCPNCKSSKLEGSVEKYLNNHNVKFSKYMKYLLLKGVGNRLLSYDFYLPKYNILIECQGKQHERPIEHFGGKKQFIIQQIHDLRKRKYAKSHGIRLITIWYNQLNDIEEILDNYLNNLKLESVETTGVA